MSECFVVAGYNAAPIVVAWVDTDEQIPARWDPPGSKLAIVPVGGLVIANASVVDNRTRPFLATGSPLFANGELLYCRRERALKRRCVIRHGVLELSTGGDRPCSLLGQRCQPTTRGPATAVLCRPRWEAYLPGERDQGGGGL